MKLFLLLLLLPFASAGYVNVFEGQCTGGHSFQGDALTIEQCYQACTDSIGFLRSSSENTAGCWCSSQDSGTCTRETASWASGRQRYDIGSPGCTDPAASNYDSSATVDVGSCIYPGCTDSGASNYDAAATDDDGSCTCGAGKGMEGGGCVACTGNTFSAMNDNSACETKQNQHCGPGERFESGGTNENGNIADNQCTPCGEGKYQDASAGHTETSCQDCGAGHHTVNLDGNFLAGTGAIGCTLCNPETHWDDDGVSHTACEATNSTCGPGLKLVHSNDNLLKNLCIDCDPNTYSSGTNSDTTCTPHSVTSCAVGDLVISPSAATDGLCCAGNEHLASGACVDDENLDCDPGQGFSDGGGANDGSCTPCVGEFSDGTVACQPITVTKCYAGEGYTAATTASDGSCTVCVGQFSDGTSACQDYRASCLGTEILSAVENGVSDKVCVANVIYGCTESDKLNYDPSANVNAGCGATKVVGCMDANYLNYDASANSDDGSCATIKVEGCTNSSALNYDALASVDDGSCVDKVVGCMDEAYVNYDASANYEDGHCTTVKVEGCTDASKLNYDPSANVDDGSCGALKVEGCMDANYLNYDASANTDGHCTTVKVEGCTDASKLNYDPSANVDDGSCGALKVEGCMDANYLNYDASANVEDGSCGALDLSGQACGDLKASYQGKSCCTSA